MLIANTEEGFSGAMPSSKYSIKASGFLHMYVNLNFATECIYFYHKAAFDGEVGGCYECAMPVAEFHNLGSSFPFARRPLIEKSMHSFWKKWMERREREEEAGGRARRDTLLTYFFIFCDEIVLTIDF